MVALGQTASEQAAAAALGRGDPLRALSFAGRIDSPRGLLVRGIAYAQLGDYALARQTLERASRATKAARSGVDAARARAALVEVRIAEGDVASAAKDAEAAAEELARLGDVRNAAMQRLVLARALVLLGRLGEAHAIVEAVLGALGAAARASDVRAVAWLAQAEIAVRGAKALAARAALQKARQSLEGARNDLLARELVALEAELSSPVARLATRGAVRTADLFAIESASTGEVLLVDACRRVVIAANATVPVRKRPVLFALLLELARAWPEPVARDELVTRAFDAKRVNDSHRARLRVEIGRLRKLLSGLAEPVATDEGYRLASPRDVYVLLPRDDGDDTARIAMLLSDGATWSAQALAEHAGVSKRTAQRALAALVEAGTVMRIGEAKDVRYARPGPRIASRMLLLGLVPAP